MHILEALEQTLLHHQAWNKVLHALVESGSSPVGMLSTLRDKDKSLHAWLKRVPNHYKKSSHYKKLVYLSDQFEEAAIKALELLQSGNAEKAKDVMDEDSKYRALADKITRELVTLIDELEDDDITIDL